jgi:thiamine biosynthesis lipoprotein
MRLIKGSFVALFFLSTGTFAVERAKYIMGTYISVYVPDKYRNFVKGSFDIFKKIDKTFSKYRPDSYVYKLNKVKKSKINSQFLELLNISFEIYKKTDGYFDITVGNITKKYGYFYKNQPENVKKETTGFKNVVIKNGYIYLKNGISLDFGGIGKGYAVDKVSDFLDKNKVKDYIVKASGDIRCKNICNICIQNPFKNAVVACFNTKFENTSISTSGNYERYIKNKNNNHLINPKTKKSEKIFASITILGTKNNTYLDAYATAVSVMPEKKALEFLEKNKIPYLIIKNNKKVLKSKNFEDYVTNFQWYGF